MSDFKTYANSFQAISKLRLESISRLCEKAGNPQKELDFIHVAGTNGKGSVCAFLQNIISLSGKRCGKFTSPNMVDVCERISVDNKNIEKNELDKLLNTISVYADEIKEETGEDVTQFEIWTLAAFIYFKQKKCDIVVLETGLGGRLDATNIIDRPLCSIITRIDMDHTEYLGNTIESIAREKAGIIKNNSAVISAVQIKEAADVITKTAKEKNCVYVQGEMPKNQYHKGMREFFDYKDMADVESGLAGIYQAENATLAIEAAQMLQIDDDIIRKGLKTAVHMGRFEEIADNLIFDGAHNPNGAEALAASVERYFPTGNLEIIYGAMKDKDIEAFAQCFKDRFMEKRVKIHTVKVKDNPRADTAENLRDRFLKWGFEAQAHKSLKEAYECSSLLGNMVIICGSLYLYKDMVNELLTTKEGNDKMITVSK